ncbi:MAG: TatD family hydrolase [Candidatus Aenigmarchaeota archaeon]|nr:TatD family hydrolase [Candidatus Aenigmarchaeota archaeon]
MIDVHAHLESDDYSSDREEVIEKCKKELKAVITSCTHPKDFDLTMQLVDKYENFVFATVSIHPEYIKEINEKEVNEFFDMVKKNKDKIVGVGETGLDFIIEESEWREKQKELFISFISLAKDLDKPLIIHARRAFEEAIEILEDHKVKNVLMHFFSAKELLERVKNNGWYISVNTALLRSKKIKKIARDIPLENLLTETDSPWLDPQGGRNTPLNVRLVIEKIAEVKKISFEEVDKVTTDNAIQFFKLRF